MQQHNASGPTDSPGRAAQNVRYGLGTVTLGQSLTADKSVDGPPIERRHDADYPAGVPAQVADAFEAYAFKVIDQGRKRYWARSLIEVIRWHSLVEVGAGDWKINNNFSKPLAEWFMAKHPDHAGFFETRERNPEHEGRQDAA